MKTKARKVVVALRMAGIAGQDKLNGIFEHLSEGHRWQLTLYRTRHEFTAETVRKDLANGTNGFIIAMPDADDALAVLANTTIPTVIMNVSGGGIEKRTTNIYFVKNDSIKVGREVAAEFLRQGNYRSYGYIKYEKPADWSTLRGQGFAARLDESGFETSFYNGDSPQKNGDSPLAKWLKLLKKPAAVMASCDDDAYKVVDTCRGLNLNIPNEVAVIGVNNDPILCENCEPRLTSIQPDFMGEGILAARLLERMMGNPKRHFIAETKLVGIRGIVRRDSTPPDSISGMMVQKALAFINRKALSGISVADVATHLKVSRSLLDLRFREHLGESVYATILNIRLEEVRRRLRNTDEPIGEIAVACGWENPASLKNLFKRLYGVSMRDWRHNPAQ